MCKEIKIFLSVLGLIFLFGMQAFAVSQPDNISAENAVVVICGSNETVYGKNQYATHSMASTTKIMSAVIALESDKIDSEITVSDEMVRVEGTSMGLLAGDSVSVRELVYGMLLSSGNDAANATAYAVGGSIEGFVSMMNEKAEQLGMNSTHFATASGLDADDHYSTAYDMAVLTSYAIQNKEFVEICSSKSASVDFGNPPYKRTLTNHNKLLKTYDGAIGVKTGFTKKSGRCLVSAAERNGTTLICVTLNAPDDWNDHKKLLDYGFSKVKKAAEYQSEFIIDVAGKENASVSAALSREPQFSLVNEEIIQKIEIEHFIYAPMNKYDKVGVAKFYYQNGFLADEVEIILDSNVENSTQLNSLGENKNFIKKIIGKLRGE